MTESTEKLAQLRRALQKAGLDGFILPVADEFLSEYVPAHAARLQWLTGFSGSAGTAVVLKEKAAFFTDGRYTLQAQQEVEPALYEIHSSGELTPASWLKANAHKGARIGFDPKLYSTDAVKALRAALAAVGAELRAVKSNPVDGLWQGRPLPNAAPAFAHPMEFAGEDSASKRKRAAAHLAEKGADAAFLSSAESINWLLNIRGRDMESTPVLQAYGVLMADGGFTLYSDTAKIPPSVQAHMGEGVAIAPFEALEEDLEVFGRAEKKLLIDSAESPYAFGELAREAGAELIFAADPCLLLKACKSAVELMHIRNAHVEDGVALARFFHWLENALEGGKAVDELGAAEKLLEFRAQGRDFLFPSFPTIAGAGAHGAIVHYRADEKSNRRLKKGELFLLDSGGHYLSGTTDVTRTLAIGAPSQEKKERFTLVLKGHIAIACAEFPQGTNGPQLDALARQFLWKEGLDYDHGTGHGVGYCLGVHEGPQRISKRGSDVALKEGMILSNEPGYYQAGEYGIRIENLVAVIKKRSRDGKDFFGFEMLTCAPIDCRLMELSMLTGEEKDWLNGYHAWVLDTLSPYLESDVNAWLGAACAAL